LLLFRLLCHPQIAAPELAAGVFKPAEAKQITIIKQIQVTGISRHVLIALALQLETLSHLFLSDFVRYGRWGEAKELAEELLTFHNHALREVSR
jgi:hypothetical protein